MEKQLISQGIKKAIDIIESEIAKPRNKHAVQFGKDLIVHLRIAQGHFMYESLHESSVSAARTLRRVLKDVIDEYRRNERNGEIFSLLAQTIMDLKDKIQEIEYVAKHASSEEVDEDLLPSEPEMQF